MATKKIQNKIHDLLERKTKLQRKKKQTQKQMQQQEVVEELKTVGEGYRPEYVDVSKQAKELAKSLLSKGQPAIEIPELEQQSKPLEDKLSPEALQALKELKTGTQTGGELIDLMGHKNYFSSIDTSDVNLQWGLGVEHEMQIFHLGKPVKMPSLMAHKKQSTLDYEQANILFDSQESTCFISGDGHESGACCKLHPDGRGHCSYYPTGKIKDQIFGKKDRLTDEELKFLKSIDWEATGRYADGCKPSPVIVKRTPVLMPEARDKCICK